MSASERKITRYKKLLRDHQRLLAKTRRAIEIIVDDIIFELENTREKHQKNSQFSPPPATENTQNSPLLNPAESDNSLNNNKLPEDQKLGKKNVGTSATSEILNKLTKTLLKLIPLELELAKMNMSRATLEELEEMEDKVSSMTKSDIQILDEFIMDYNRQNGIFINPETRIPLRDMTEDYDKLPDTMHG